MTQYVKKTFEHAWQAAKFVDDGGALFTEGGMQVTASNAFYIVDSGRDIYAIKPTDWREQLDGTVENGVLCWVSNDYIDPSDAPHLSMAVIIVDIVTGGVSDTYMNTWTHATPLTQSEIDKLKGNAPV